MTCACSSSPPRPPRGRAVSIVSTALLVLMPKCPFCLVAWTGALGLGGYASHVTMIPSAVLVIFCASQAAFFFTARRTRDFRSLALAAIGVVAILVAALLHLGPAIRFAGVALLVVASALNAISFVKRGGRGSSRPSRRASPCHPPSQTAPRA